MAFVADGYDKQAKIGYVFGDWRTLDEDALIDWANPPTPDIAKMAAAIVQRAHWLKELEPLAKEIEAANKLPDPGRKQAALKAIVASYRAKRMSMDEAQQVNQRASEGKEYIAVISQFDRRFVQGEIDYDEYQQIEKIADPGKRDIAHKRLKAKAARAALQKLEQAVREYIAWARSQGAG